MIRNYASITGLQFTLLGSNGLEQSLRYFAAVPVGKMFKAYVYLPNGQPYLQFDQNGDYLEQMYDSFGRLNHKKNSKGEVVEAQEIKYAKPDLTATKQVDVILFDGYYIEQGITPKILSVSFRDVTGQLRSIDFPVNMYPSQVKTIRIPALVYDFTISTDMGYNKITINDVPIIDGSNSNNGVTNYRLDLSNGQPVKYSCLIISGRAVIYYKLYFEPTKHFFGIRLKS